MPEKKLKASVGESMMTDSIEIKSKGVNSDYDEFQEDLARLILEGFKEVTSSLQPSDNLSVQERSLIAASRIRAFLESLPVLIIGYLHKKGALSSSKDTRRLDWVIKKWGEAGFSMGYDYQAKEPWVDVSSDGVAAEKWGDLRAFIDDHMAREIN